MSHPFEHVSWQETILGVRRPLQFFALALTIPALPLSTMLLNETIVSTLGRDGLLLLSTITAAVQVFALVLGTFIVYHQQAAATESVPRPDGAPPSKHLEEAAASVAAAKNG
ncbi:MAG TPA: hypothetical protein VFR81_21955 [Longimicrobium sp.]|nr:hypothetical protein [Longimicrobium sp.]